MRQGNKDSDCGLGDLDVCKNKMISTVMIQVFNQQKQMASVIILSTEDKGSGPNGADFWSQVATGCDLARSRRQQKQLHCVQQR